MARLNDVRSVGQAIQQGLAEPGIGEHLGPFREREVGRNDHRGFFCTLRDHRKQQFRPQFRQGDIAQFIDTDQIVARPTRNRPA